MHNEYEDYIVIILLLLYKSSSLLQSFVVFGCNNVVTQLHSCMEVNIIIVFLTLLTETHEMSLE